MQNLFGLKVRRPNPNPYVNRVGRADAKSAPRRYRRTAVSNEFLDEERAVSSPDQAAMVRTEIGGVKVKIIRRSAENEVCRGFRARRPEEAPRHSSRTYAHCDSNAVLCFPDCFQRAFWREFTDDEVIERLENGTVYYAVWSQQ